MYLFYGQDVNRGGNFIASNGVRSFCLPT